MTMSPRAVRRLAFILPLVLLGSQPGSAQDRPTPQPRALQTGDTVPWLYEGSDVPRDKEWVFGKLPNGLRYAVRKNGVPPDQVSIRVRIDAGSLHEADAERGYAHLLEHLLFRESKYLGPAEAIPRWQRLGATFGSDTNAETSPTHTVFKLDLPNVSAAKLDESMKLLSGMVRAPVLSDRNVAAEVPIVLAEMRERGGAQERAARQARETLFAGQRLATRDPIGTEQTLLAARGSSVSAFHKRWYRPENVVVVAAGDVDPMLLAATVEKYFADWEGRGKPVAAPAFGDPVAPAGVDAANPVGETAVVVEPDLPRSLDFAVMRPWRPVQDTIVYNEGLLRDSLALAVLNRRLETRARSGGSFLYAQAQQEDVSRSTDATFVSFAPLSEDWRKALGEVRGVIADALATPPTQAELDRELAEFGATFASLVEQRRVMAGAKLADDIVTAVDIRETVAAPETVLTVFNSMKDKVTPAEILAHTRALFSGAVIRATYTTPATGEADAAALRAAMMAPAIVDPAARAVVKQVSFADLPPIGAPGKLVQTVPVSEIGIERVDFANGVRALIWANDAEPGRITVKVRFGGGYRSLQAKDAPYASLAEIALVGSGIGELGQEELDAVRTGRRIGFDFGIGEGAFTFTAQTRRQDLADQLYLLAGKLAMPRWDPAPFERAKAAARLAYDGYATSPAGVLGRDLEWLARDRDARYRTPDPAALAAASPAGFRATWEPLLRQGPVEVIVFGDFDKAEGIEALRRTFGALAPREPLPPAIAARGSAFPEAGETVVEYHRGDANQAAAVIAWETGAGLAGLRESRQLEILTQLFNNRLMQAMREHAGASYAPVVRSEWPSDVPSGGRISALAQLKPEDVPIFFREADRIASDLATKPVGEDELTRVTEPLLQLLNRASTGNTFWLYQLEGATFEPQRIALLRSLLRDYTVTTPQAMQALAAKYLAGKPGWRLAVIPQGQELATRVPEGARGASSGR